MFLILMLLDAPGWFGTHGRASPSLRSREDIVGKRGGESGTGKRRGRGL